MKIATSHKWPLILILVVAAGVLFVFIRMYHDDIKALKDFMASYEKFDRDISDLSLSGTVDAESKTGDAVTGLDARASLKLSSLIKNDAELMTQAREVADLARREIDSFRVCRSGHQNKNADSERLAEEYRVLASERKAAFARFRELGGTH